MRELSDQVHIKCHTPVDISGGKPGVAMGRSLLGRGLRRVDAMARWQGLSYDPDEMTKVRALLDQLVYDESGVVSLTYENSAKKKQKKIFDTVTGQLSVTGELSPLMPMLHVLERCQLGRGAVQGLGVIEVIT